MKEYEGLSINYCKCGWKGNITAVPYGSGLEITCEGCKARVSNPDVFEEVIENWNLINPKATKVYSETIMEALDTGFNELIKQGNFTNSDKEGYMEATQNMIDEWFKMKGETK